MRQTVIQESFSAGAISPLTYGRYSSEGYQQGCKELENMIPDSRGPAMSRDGTNFIGEFDGNNGRIFGYQVNSSFFYTIVLLDNELTIGSVTGQVPATNYASNSHFHYGGKDWTVGQSDSSQTADFSDHRCELTVTHSANKYVYIAQQITVPSSGNYKILVSTQGGAIYDVLAGTAAADGTYLDTQSANANEVFDITVPGTTFWVTVRKDSNDSFDPVGVHFVGATDAAIITPSFVTPWAEAELSEVHAIPVPDGGVVYLVHPNHPPQKLTYDTPTDSFSFAAVSFTAAPSEWTTDNYPSTGAYFEGRLWLAGPPDHRQHIWSSKSGLPEDFSVGTGLDDEAIVIVLAAYGGIEWIGATKNLLVGTEAGEHIITSEAGILTPSDHQVTQQSAYGSAGIQSEQVGDQIFYVSPDGRKLRAMQYEWSKDNWLSTDLTYFSQHITHARIKSIAWLQNPQNLFICILEDGHFAVLSYDRSNNIYGWSHHSIGDECIDICVTSTQGTSILGILVKRVDGKLYYESQAFEPNRFVDSWIEQFHDPEVTTITGLDHLEGRTVQVMANDAVHPDRVVSSGQIELEVEVGKVLVGLQYNARMKLLPFEKGAQTGSSAPYWKNFTRVDVHLLDSAMPLVNGIRAAVRHPSTPMDTPEPVTTGKSSIKLTEWKNETDITIEQDLPFPLVVLAVSGEINQEKL